MTIPEGGTMDWTIKPPEEPGYYWFYGWVSEQVRGPLLYCISTVIAPVDVTHFIGIAYFDVKRSYGMWAPIAIPNLPPIPPKDMEVTEGYTYRTEDEPPIQCDLSVPVELHTRESERELCAHRVSLTMRELGICADDRNKVLAAIYGGLHR